MALTNPSVGAAEPASQRRAPILRLPPVVQHLIKDHLDLADCSCVALASCLFRPLYKVDHTLQGAEQAGFLRRLEGDPSTGRLIYYCDGCNKLHSWGQDWSPTSTSEKASWVLDWKLDCSLRRFSHMFKPLNGTYSIAHHHIRLVMNAHHRGLECGLPVTQLEGESRDRFGPVNVVVKTAARISPSHELVLKRKYKFNCKRIDIADILEYGQRHDATICPHNTFVGGPLPGSCVIPWNTLRKQAPLQWSKESACLSCLTEYRLYICSRSRHRRIYTVELSSYHILGEGRDSKDWKWASITGTDGEDGSGRRQRKQWNKRVKKTVRDVWRESGLAERPASEENNSEAGR
ncbi:hypothetical protein FZEAL_9751 [Fusarium zealandicum]|uniref:F-box domain-containing protein n=1 Tax=Fusarium zealandicum TaxID=1053134 RepID=A0A8H4U8K6_9HYPO|nr:hypothetical protein FZEAL_9751 [Fusarium zealandicum]